MTILASDIKLLESERMRDTADGGGRMTSNEIPDGVAGNVFPKVSRLDAVYGRVNLRKVYAAVRAANLDVYAGAHCVITDPPDNDRIRCLLFSTGSHFDTRQQARDRIESYVVAGPESRWFLYGDQVVGQKAVTMYAPPSEPLPDVGDVLCLSVESGALSGTQQYIRITDVESEVRTFDDTPNPDYQRRIVTIKISDNLRYTFKGDTMTRYPSHPVADAALVRLTQVADASKYYGVMALDAAANAGDMTIKVASVYDALVPSATRETAVSLAGISDAAVLVDAASAAVRHRVLTNYASETLYTLRLPVKPKPGSLRLYIKTAVAQSTGAEYLVFDPDTGAGMVDGLGPVPVTNWPMMYDQVTQASVDWETWTVTLMVRFGAITGGVVPWVDAEYIPVAEVSEAAHTDSTPVTLATRGTVYTRTLAPIPAPGTLIVDYRALGRWYRLRDDGAGQLVGNSAGVGTGSVDYVTGAIVVTLGALPDVDSSVLYAWGSPAHYKVLTTSTDKASKDFILAYPPVKPGTVSLAWTEGGVAKTAADDGAGVITGATATGTIDYTGGAIHMEFDRAPDTTVSVDYDQYTESADSVATTNVHDAAQAIAPFSVRVNIRWRLPDETYQIGPPCYDDGLGSLRLGNHNSYMPLSNVSDYVIHRLTVVGSVNYSTGVITLNDTVMVRHHEYNTAEWVGADAGLATLEALNFEFRPASATASLPQTFIVQQSHPLKVTLGQADPMYIVPGSVMFDAAGQTYVDRSGTLYTDIDYSTGSGTEAGTINYATGAVELTSYATDVPLALNVKACLGRYGDWTAAAASFRTPGAPLRSASFYVQATTPGGTVLTGTADVGGALSGSITGGTVNQQMGVATVNFGQAVLPGTIRFSCVVQTSLPLDADLLGIDPVRLPSDGRVAIYRPGDVCLVHDTQLYTLPDPAVAAAVYNVGRTDLSLLELVDADGVEVPGALYTADLVAGTVTMADPLDLTGYTQPLQARHRVEDMVLLSDAQINGELSLTAALNHDYTTNSYISSALLFGDLQAYVTNLFDQQTWTSVWSDSLIGSQATAQYNDLDHPVEVLNESAIKERWRINFTSSTAFQLYGENLGLIATGDTSTDLAPVNPVTSQPYFILRAAGWGAGWSAGNQLRFNTEAGNAPIWIARTVLAGATLAGDSFDLAVRGDVD